MGISCECDFEAGYDYDGWWWEHARGRDFAPLATKRARRCYCCEARIRVGDDCGKLIRYRYARSDIEERIHGDEVQLSDIYLCEECYGLMLSVEEHGACVSLEAGVAMKDQVSEWADLMQSQEW